MYLINDALAIDAIPQKKPEMRYVDAVVGNIQDFIIIDVRMLKDDRPNPVQEYMLNIIRVTSWLQCDEKVVICSSTGRSRAAAIALGVLVKYFKMNFYNALEFLRKKVPTADINNTHTDSLERLFCVQA
jgi:hypothetical protein